MGHRVLFACCFLLLILTFHFSSGVLYAEEQALSDINIERLKKNEQARPWGRDPFVLPAQGAGGANEEGLETGFRLSAIIYRKGQGVAIINNRIVKVGDVLEGMQVTEIRPDRVLLRGASGDRELRVSRFVAGQ